MWWLSIAGALSAAEVTSEEQGVPAPQQAPQLGAPVLGKGSTTFGCESKHRFHLLR